VLDGEQLGYGAAYRLYQGADGEWFALAVPDSEAWERLRALVDRDELPASPPPLRTDDDGLQPAELLLAEAFVAKDAVAWVTALRAADVPVEPVRTLDRGAFIAGLLDDPVNRQLGRVVAYQWGDRGVLEQPAFPVRFGPAPRPVAPARVPALGEHTREILDALGVGESDKRA
jgi:crotonobetainyl-CoA:carnitine CoA-transferase CaiB-like acyl-CoA transferase